MLKAVAQTVGQYGSDFYEGMPCLTKNSFGKGEAWWIGGQLDLDGLTAVYAPLIRSLGLEKALPDELPHGVVAVKRGRCVFLQNFSGRDQTVMLNGMYTDMITGETITGRFVFPKNGVMALA